LELKFKVHSNQNITDISIKILVLSIKIEPLQKCEGFLLKKKQIIFIQYLEKK
jgi:hypothetical protein